MLEKKGTKSDCVSKETRCYGCGTVFAYKQSGMLQLRMCGAIIGTVRAEQMIDVTMHAFRRAMVSEASALFERATHAAQNASLVTKRFLLRSEDAAARGNCREEDGCYRTKIADNCERTL